VALAFHPRTDRPGPIDGLLAGVAEVDLTPPPGMPKAGHSRSAHDGIGFRTRIRARVLHLRAGTASLALVACDLQGGSAVLNHLVAERVARTTDVRLPGLFIGVTHTHAGPGQFQGSDFYNRFCSNRPGFDPAYTDFLADRIAGAVEEAVATRVPARLGAGRTEVWGFTRNRSHACHVRNDSVEDKRTDPQRKWVDINPWLHLIRVDTDAGPLGAFVVFSIHGTGISHGCLEYNADVWAYLVGTMQRRIGAPLVVGAVEGTHGDVAPAVRPGMLVYPEAQRVGAGIGEAAAGLWDRLGPALTGDVALAAGLRELDLHRDRSIDGIELSRRPAIGIAKLAGAAENLTPVIHRLPPFGPGRPNRRPSAQQGAKTVFGSPVLQRVIAPSRSFPWVLPIQVLRVGPATLVALPHEITVEAGRRIESVVGGKHVIVSSAANDYWDYVTTPEEYAGQHYEGASTLWGPNTAAFLAAHSASLARAVERDGWVADVQPVRRFSLKVHRYLARPTGASSARQVLAPPRFTDPTAVEDGYWELRWRDVAPGDLHWHEPLVHVLDDGGAVVADDQGWDIGVVHLGDSVYAARWYGPVLRAGRRHRFVLVANAGRPEVVSDPFD
jgi:neutral ceramidase